MHVVVANGGSMGFVVVIQLDSLHIRQVSGEFSAHSRLFCTEPSLG